MQQDRSTLFTSPISFADFAFRLVFFSAAPFGIVAAAALYPVRGALVDVGLALSVFLAGEGARRAARRVRPIGWFLSEALKFEGHYRARPPRSFVYYLFYPLLFPYWLVNQEARKEFLMFRGYTVGSAIVLVGSLVWQYFNYWQPELGIKAFLPTVLISFVVETLFVLALLMPIATTVVWYHSSFRRGRLMVVLVAGLLSTTVALAMVMRRRDPVVSYSTRERVRLRTTAARSTAHSTLVAAARVAWRETVKLKGLEGDGKVEGAPLDGAHERLEQFYKHDEAAAFDLWASPRRHPRILVLYIEGRTKKPPIWVAIGGDGTEIKKLSELPQGATSAMRRAADGTDPLLPIWPEDVPKPGR